MYAILEGHKGGLSLANHKPIDQSPSGKLTGEHPSWAYIMNAPKVASSWVISPVNTSEALVGKIEGDNSKMEVIIIFTEGLLEVEGVLALPGD